MANVQESFSRAPSFRKILTETMVWPGSESRRQAELEIPAKFVQAHGDKFHTANEFRGPSCQLMTIMVKIRTKSHGQMRVSFLDGWDQFTFVNGFKKDDHLVFYLVAVSTFYVQVIDKSPKSPSRSRDLPISSMLPPNTSRLRKCVELGTQDMMMASHADERHEQMVCKTSTNHTSSGFSVQEGIRVVQEQDFCRESTGPSKSLELISSMIPPNTLHLGESAEFIGTETSITHADGPERFDESMVGKLLSTNCTSSDFSAQDERVVTQERGLPAETDSVENLGDSHMMRWMKRVERRIQHHQLPPRKVVQFKIQLASSAVQHFGSDLCAHLILPAKFGRRTWLTLPRLVSLQGPQGGLWPVQCVKYYFHSMSSVHFKAGWGAFVEENLLEVGDELGFTLTAQAHFEVNIVKKAWSSKKKRSGGRCLPAPSIDIITIS